MKMFAHADARLRSLRLGVSSYRGDKPTPLHTGAGFLLLSHGRREGHQDFLSSRRARIKPEDVGLPPGGRRRVPGLRREEVAQLAGVSTEYYVQIERGKVAGVSDDVLRAVGTALRLTDDEVAHFFDLV